MRDPDRIDEFLTAVANLWRRYPDLRFGQLVANVLPGDPFYLEGDDALRLFQEANWDNEYDIGGEG